MKTSLAVQKQRHEDKHVNASINTQQGDSSSDPEPSPRFCSVLLTGVTATDEQMKLIFRTLETHFTCQSFSTILTVDRATQLNTQ